MKNIFTPILLFGLGALLFVGCGGEDDVTPSLNIADAEITIPYTGGERTFGVEANVEWEATSNAEWLRISSFDRTSVTVSADETDAARMTMVVCRVPSKTSVSKTITVRQEGKPVQLIDSMALVELYNATGGASWTTKWNLSQPISQWYGVEMKNGRVAGLDLSGNNLSGTIPNGFYKLSMLEELNLNDNNLSGTLSADIGKLNNLVECELVRNQLSGALPMEIRMLAKLRYLDLSENEFSGDIPDIFATLSQLIMLDVSYNKLTGAFPSTLQNLPKISYLAMCNNKLNGSLPSWLNNLTSLTMIDLSFNNFTASMPNLSGLVNLKVLYLYKNAFSGAITAVNIGNLPKLKILGLDGNNLLGAIPAAIGEIATLEKLYLEYNNLMGDVPASLLNNPHWPEWRNTVINQQGGRVLDEPGYTPAAAVKKSIEPRPRPSKEAYKR